MVLRKISKNGIKLLRTGGEMASENKWCGISVRYKILIRNLEFSFCIIRPMSYIKFKHQNSLSPYFKIMLSNGLEYKSVKSICNTETF